MLLILAEETALVGVHPVDLQFPPQRHASRAVLHSLDSKRARGVLHARVYLREKQREHPFDSLHLRRIAATIDECAFSKVDGR